MSKHGGKREGAGRKKGSSNAVNKLLKEAIIEAAESVGSDQKGTDGLVGYLTERAKDQPTAFMGMLGKVIPLQVEGGDNAIKIEVTKTIVDPES